MSPALAGELLEGLDVLLRMAEVRHVTGAVEGLEGALRQRLGNQLGDGLRQNGAILKRDTYALYLAVRDPRTWYATVVGATVVAYLLSPLDLIPDSIPVVGYLDELIIVPAGIVLVLRLLPDELVACWRDQARTKLERPTSWVGAAVMIGLWLALVLSLTMVVSKVSD